jgi:hypothetical protein
MKSQWTAVEDGLPSEDGQYLVTENSKYVELYHFRNNQWGYFIETDWHDLLPPLAWMPLPKAYEK